MKATSIRLTDAEESTLTQLAAKLRCHSRYGATSGQPSWRVMLQHIAEGRLKVTNPMDKTRQIFINFKRPPGWWKPDEKESMPAAEVAKKYKTTIEILEEKGFVVDGDRIYAGNWKGWRIAGETKKETEPTPEPSPAPAHPEMAAIARPDWFKLSPTGAAMMLPDDAVRASQMSLDELEVNGYRIITHNSQKFLTGPAGAEWDCDGANDQVEARRENSPLPEKTSTPLPRTSC